MSAPTADVLRPLIDRMATGDRDALTEFVGLVAPWVHGALLRITRNQVAAGALVEDTLRELWRAAPLYDDQWGPPMTWTMAVARGMGMTWRDKRRGREHRLKSQSDAADVLLPDGSSADEAAAAAFGTVDEDGREALRSAWFEGVPGGAQGQASRDRLSSALDALAAARRPTQVEAE